MLIPIMNVIMIWVFAFSKWPVEKIVNSQSHPAPRSMNDKQHFSETLCGIDRPDYGPDYDAHILEQYKLYVKMADQISARRERANAFFLVLNTSVIPIIGFLFYTPLVATPLFFIGMLFSYLWFRIIRSYRDLNIAKFNVVREIEALLPLRLYETEWQAVGKGEDKKLYLPLTHVETVVPVVFLTAYILIFLIILLVILMALLGRL